MLKELSKNTSIKKLTVASTSDYIKAVEPEERTRIFPYSYFEPARRHTEKVIQQLEEEKALHEAYEAVTTLEKETRSRIDNLAVEQNMQLYHCILRLILA